MDDLDASPFDAAHGPDGATPLTDEEREGLRLSWVASQADLNAAEATNIAAARRQKRWRGLSTDELLDDVELRKLHKVMFGDVWTWAGRYRTSERNIGCDPAYISVNVRNLCEDAKYWFGGTYRPDEAGSRFHHALVAIHPFANGNGRHAREATDLLLQSVGVEPFTWGRVNLTSPSAARSGYIDALRAADRGDHTALLAFVRT